MGKEEERWPQDVCGLLTSELECDQRCLNGVAEEDVEKTALCTLVGL